GGARHVASVERKRAEALRWEANDAVEVRPDPRRAPHDHSANHREAIGRGSPAGRQDAGVSTQTTSPRERGPVSGRSVNENESPVLVVDDQDSGRYVKAQ